MGGVSCDLSAELSNLFTWDSPRPVPKRSVGLRLKQHSFTNTQERIFVECQPPTYRQTDRQTRLKTLPSIKYRFVFNLPFEHDDVLLKVPMGIQIATSIRVGQYLGAGNPVGAMTTGRLGITLVCEYFTLLLNHGHIQNPLQKGEAPPCRGAPMIFEKFPKNMLEIEKKGETGIPLDPSLQTGVEPYRFLPACISK